MASKLTYEQLEQRIKELEEQATKYTQLKDALIESESRYRLLYHNALVAMYTVTLDGKPIAVNSVGLSMLGYASEEEFFEKFQWNNHWVNPDDREQMIQELVEKGEIYHYQALAQTTKGEQFWNEFSVRINSNNTIDVVAIDITERKRAEDALQESEERYRSLFEGVEDHLFVIDQDFRYTMVNPSVLKAGGFAWEDVEGRGPRELFPEDAEFYLSQYRNVFKTGESTSFQRELRLPDGLHWYSVTLSPVKNKQRRVIALTGISRDITEHKQAEEALRESEEKFRLLSEQNLLGIAILQDGLVKYVNNAASEITEYSIEEAREWKADEYIKLFHPDDLEFVMKQAKKKQAGDKDITQHYSYRIITRSGHVKWVDQYSKTIFLAGKNADFITLIDLTERKQAEEALRKKEKELEMITDNIPGLVSYVDANGCYRFVNKQYEEWFGLQKKEIVGKYYRAVLGDTTYQQIKRYVEEALSGKLVHFEEALPYKSGGTRWVKADYVPDIDEQGSVKGFFALVTDITGLKLSEEALRESEAQKKAILDSTIDRIRLSDTDMRIIWANEAYFRELDMTLEDVQGEYCYKVFVGRETSCPGCPGIKARESGKTEHAIMYLPELKGIEGDTYWDVYGVPIKNETGEITGIIQTARNITEQKQMEEALRESEAQKKAILDSTVDRIRLSDTDMRIIWANQTHARDLNLVPEDIVGKACYEVFLGRNSPCPECPAQKALTSGKTEHTLLARPIPRNTDKKKYLDAYFVPLKDESGRIVYVLQVTRDITAKVMAEKRLQQSEERYRELANSITDVFFAMDGSLRYTYWNKASEELTGIPANDAIGKSLFEVFPDNPGTRKAERAYREVLKKRASKSFLSEYALKGRRYFFDITAYPSRDGLSVFVKDITKQKEIELAFWESEKRYRSLFDGVPIGLYRETPDGKVLDANNALLEIMDYPNRETVLRADTRELYVNQKDRDLFQDTVEKQGAIHGFETQLYRYDGTPVWVGINARAVKNADGSILYYEGSMADIAERKQSEKRIKFLAEVLSSSPFSVIATDKGERIIYVNPAAERLFGYTHDELLGKDPIILNADPNADKIQSDIFDTIRQGRVWRGEILNKKKNGELFPIFASVYQLLDQEGNFIAIVGFQIDITEQKQAEEELRDSQYQLRNLADHLQSVREGERTAIAREIHDELGQALTGLKMDLSWLAKKIPKDQRQLLDKLHSMSELTSNTLRTVQRISTELRPGLLDDLGLVAAIEWQTEEFQNRTGIRCTLSVDPEDITLDEKRSTSLFRILQETITNVARHAQATRVHVSLQEKDNHLELRVRDNGKGITGEQISDPKSFGLIGIKERVHSWGGKVTINGRPGKGTTVVVRMTVKD